MPFILFIVALVGTATVAALGYLVGYGAGRKSVAEDQAEELAELLAGQRDMDHENTVSRIKQILAKPRV